MSERLDVAFKAAHWKLDESIRSTMAAFGRLVAAFPTERRAEFRKYERRVERARSLSRTQTQRRRGHGRQ